VNFGNFQGVVLNQWNVIVSRGQHTSKTKSKVLVYLCIVHIYFSNSDGARTCLEVIFYLFLWFVACDIILLPGVNLLSVSKFDLELCTLASAAG